MRLAAKPPQHIARFIARADLIQPNAVEIEHLITAENDAGVRDGNLQRLGFRQ